MKLATFPIRELTEYCRRVGMSETRFGRLAVNDPRVARDIRNGCMFRPAKIAKLRGFMRDNPDGVPLRVRGKPKPGAPVQLKIQPPQSGVARRAFHLIPVPLRACPEWGQRIGRWMTEPRRAA